MKPAQKQFRKQSDSTWPLVLAAFIFLLGVYLVFSALTTRSAQVVEVVNPRQAELERQQKVDYYKRQLGEKLNRSRSLAEHELVKEANQPAPRYHEPRGYRESVDGLPLDYETVTYAPREQSKPTASHFPDQRVAYDLRDDQNAEFWEEEARMQFLRQYLLNARAKGYDLAIDSNYNVIVKKTPQRLAQAQRVPQNTVEGSEILPKFVALRFRPPFFSPPPYCH